MISIPGYDAAGLVDYLSWRAGLCQSFPGINTAIADGGNLIARLEKAGGGAGVEISVLAGDNHMFGPVPGDVSAPSDGLVFVDSVLNTDAMVAGGHSQRKDYVQSEPSGVVVLPQGYPLDRSAVEQLIKLNL